MLKIFRLTRLRVAPVFGDGSQELSAVHASDLSQALVATGESAATIGGVYTACHPEVFTSAELGRAVAETMGRSATTIRIPRLVGRALLTLTEAGARLSRSGHDPYYRQGERILSAGLDRRSGTTDP